MTLEALLKLLRESILNDRTDRVAGTSDYLWTDETLVTFINEAQRRFAVKGLVLRDGYTPEVTRITLVPGQRLYPLHKSVLAVISARRDDQDVDLNRTGHAILGAQRPSADNWVDPAVVIALPPGAPLAFSTDEELTETDEGSLSRVTLRVYPTPSDSQADKVLQLRVLRKPIDELSLDNPAAHPEIPEDHHIEMLDWAAYLALRIVDDDAGAPKRAEEFRQMFEAHVEQARKIAMRKLFAPLGWGFGRGGYRWDS